MLYGLKRVKLDSLRLWHTDETYVVGACSGCWRFVL